MIRRSIAASVAILAISCTTAPPAPAPAAVTTPPPAYGFTLDEEVRILMLEDRREFDAAAATEWLSHPNALHRVRMALALGRIGPHTFIDTNKNGERDAGERQAGVDLLAALTGDADRTVRETAAFALGEIGDLAGAEALTRFASDADAGVAAEAVEALSKLAPRLPLTTYAAFADASRPEGVRARALRYLFRFNSDEASAIAASALDAPSPLVRQEAAYALSRRGSAPARARLELLLGDPAAITRSFAAAALGRIAAKESLPVLLAATRDPYTWVRTNAVIAIARIAAKDATAIGGNELARDAMKVIDLSTDPDPGTRAASMDTLGYYAAKSTVARERLLETIRTGSRWERELAIAAGAKQFGPGDAALPKSPTSWEKVRILEASANAPSWGGAARKQYAADADAMVRAAAIGAIPDAGAEGEIDLILTAMNDVDVVMRANAIDRYAHVAKPDIQLLHAAEDRGRRDAMNDARLAAINAIGEVEHEQREAFLRSLLADDDPVVRRVAADLIEQKLKKNRPQFTPLKVTRTADEYARIVSWSHAPHTATIHMTRGKIELALLAADAPVTTWNFAELARKRFFDNTTFMRVVPNFVIQGGDPRNDMNGGPGYAIRDEINLQKYTRGAVGMALSGPDTGGSQFFITHSPQPHLDGGYTIFGRVYEGMSGVVDQTERGDKVETITIDEHSPVASSSLSPPTPLPLEIGMTTAERLLGTIPDYGKTKASYQPDASEVEFMASSIEPGDRVEVFLGTWCSDSLREVPKFLNIVDTLKAKHGKDLTVSFVALDRSKAKPESLIQGKSIEKVPTFIFYRGTQELGRIVERPHGLFEDDMLAIVAAKK